MSALALVYRSRSRIQKILHTPCFFEPKNVKLYFFQKSPTKIPFLGLRVSPHLKRTKFELGLIDEVSLLNTTPRILPTPTVLFDLRSFKKDTTDPETYKQFYLKLVSEYPKFLKVFTDG